MRFYEARMRQMFFERTQHWIEPFDVAYLKYKTAARRQFRKLSSMCRVIGDRFLDQHMFAFGEQSACDVVVSIGGRCHGSGVNHLAEIIERFGRCRPGLTRNDAAPERLYIVYRGELSRRNFRVQPRMIASDMPNTNNANAQLFHRSPNAVNPESFRRSTLERGRVGALRRPDAAAWRPYCIASFARNHS